MKKVKLFTLFFVLVVIFGCGSNAEQQGKEAKAWITEPAKARYTQGEEVPFVGSGQDWYVDDEGEWESYEITGSDLLWTSSIDGTIGVGNEFKCDGRDFTPGEHKITLTAIGLNGNKDKATVKLMIIDPNQNPEEGL